MTSRTNHHNLDRAHFSADGVELVAVAIAITAVCAVHCCACYAITDGKSRKACIIVFVGEPLVVVSVIIVGWHHRHHTSAEMNTIREVQKINQLELDRGIAGTSASWHAKYAHSAWVYAGNLDRSMTEGDILCVLSQYGELEDIHLVRDETTGESRGFAFAKYEDARSCVLAVDNLCGITLCGRSLRIDHVENYRLPKNIMEKEEELKQKGIISADESGKALPGIANEFSLDRGRDLFAPSSHGQHEASSSESEQGADSEAERERKEAKQKRKEERQRIRAEREERRKKRESRREDKERHKDRHGSDHERKKHKKERR
jgi:RNA-binding motif protein, X-linked 2